MDSWTLLLEIVILLAGCLLFGGILSALKQNPLVGYLLAGMLLGGPGGMGVIQAEANIEAIAELGVALLLFSLGLEFSWQRLCGLGRSTLAAGAVQVVLTAVCCAAAVLMYGLSLREAVALGAMVSLSSTAAVLLACGEHAACLWAGDSRVYLCREGHLSQLTRDHSQAEEMRAKGWVASEADIPAGVRNVITRAVGASQTLEVDEARVEVRDGDLFLLCSDGLSNLLSDEEIAAALGAGRCRDAVESLVELALARGGRDNISAVVARAEDLYNSDKTMLNPDL